MPIYHIHITTRIKIIPPCNINKQKGGENATQHQEQINKIIQKQNTAETLHQQIMKELAEANQLTQELKKHAGDQFIHEGTPYKITHTAIGYGAAGNQYWLRIPKDMPTIK